MELSGNMWGAIVAFIMLINTVISIRNGRKTDDVHKVINSQLTAERLARNEQETKLVAATQRAAHAEGFSEALAVVSVKEKV